MHQADLLFLPTDNGFKYALVVVDVGTRLCDAEPLSEKKSEIVVTALKKIYARKIISWPMEMMTDSGKEFEGKFKQLMNEKKINHQYAFPGRHRQMSIVESTNKVIGKGLFLRMNAQELLTGHTSREWIEDLPIVIKYINDKREREPTNKIPTDIRCNGDDCNILTIGTKVRVKLSQPKDLSSDRTLSERFRATDTYWDPFPRKFLDIMLMPGQPPLYRVSVHDNPDEIDHRAAYTKKQLQIVHENEVAPNPNAIRGNPESYIAVKVVDKKKERNRIYYKVRWRGFDANSDSWQLGTEVRNDIPNLVREYEQSIK